MKITSLRRQKKRPDRVNVYLDGEYAFAVSAEVVLKAGLRRGQEVDDALRADLSSQDDFWRAREAALVLLSHRARSEREIIDRLIRRGFTESTAARCVENLRERGLVDDLSFARAFIRDRQRSRPSGRSRLMAELRRKGVAPAVAEVALDELAAAGGEDELELGRRALGKFPRRKNEERLATRRRLYAYLARRGFGSGAISRLAREYLDSGD